MSKLELHTSVEEIIECEDIPGITIKKVNIGKDYFWTPIRSVYLSTEIPVDIRNSILKLKTRQSLFEANRVIYKEKQYKATKAAIAENDDQRIKNILKTNERISNEKFSISFSFSDFPNQNLGESFEGLLDAIHSFSEVILFVPHVRYSKTATTAREYDAKPYCRYVDYAVDVLNEKNTKPIFVPFDVDYPQKISGKILGHYAKKGYVNIWVDLKGKWINRNTIRKIRTFWRIMNKIFGPKSKDVIIYLTNIRKVPRRGLGDIRLAPSDFLGVFTYGDFVGAPFKGFMGYTNDPDYWLKKGYTSKEEYDRDLLRRESSIFDSSSYYYIPPERLSFRDIRLENIRRAILNMIALYNNRKDKEASYVAYRYKAEKASYSASGIITFNEINLIKREIVRERRILDYVENKDFFKNEGVSLLEELAKPGKVSERKDSGLFDFL